MIYAAKAFEAKGSVCALWGLEGCCGSLPCFSLPADAIRNASLIVLGIPVSRDGICLNAPMTNARLKLTELLALLNPGQTVAMGMAPVRFKEALRQKGCHCFEYQESDTFAISNALATAEGALAIALKEHPDTLFGARCAVLGFGRIGKQLCRLLLGVGAHVTVFARKESDLAYAVTLGCRAMPLNSLSELTDQFALIFNTVPVRLQEFPHPDCRGLIIDLAPVYQASETPRLLRAPSLPVQYAPRSSGKLIYDCLVSHFSEESEAKA